MQELVPSRTGVAVSLYEAGVMYTCILSSVVAAILIFWKGLIRDDCANDLHHLFYTSTWHQHIFWRTNKQNVKTAMAIFVGAH